MIKHNDAMRTITEMQVITYVKEESIALGTRIVLSDGTVLNHEVADEELVEALETVDEDSKNSKEMHFMFHLREVLEHLIPTIAGVHGVKLERGEEVQED